jgi:hypothetical protein
MTTLRPNDDICPRCGVSNQATHHSACQERDGTPTSLTDDEVRACVAGHLGRNLGMDNGPGTIKFDAAVQEGIRERAHEYLIYMFDTLDAHQRARLMNKLAEQTGHFFSHGRAAESGSEEAARGGHQSVFEPSSGSGGRLRRSHTEDGKLHQF